MRKFLMSKRQFSKQLMIDQERENKAKQTPVLAYLLSSGSISKKEKIVNTYKKEKVKPVYLRAPESLWKDIHEIMARTGLSMNAICLELLRPEIKRKLKELKED